MKGWRRARKSLTTAPFKTLELETDVADPDVQVTFGHVLPWPSSND